MFTFQALSRSRNDASVLVHIVEQCDDNYCLSFFSSLQQAGKQWNSLDKLPCAHPAVIHTNQTNSTIVGITRDCLLTSPAIGTQMCFAKVSFYRVSVFPQGQMVVDGGAVVQIWALRLIANPV